MVRFWFKLGVPAIALASSLIVANPALACTTDHHFIGAYATIPSYASGAKAWMNTDAAKQNCEATSIWVMLTGGTGSYSFAQVGLIQTYGQSSQHLFYEWATTTSYGPVEEQAATAPSGKYPYAVKYDSINKTYYFKFNNSAIGSISNIGWTPYSNQFYAEVWALEDYVPGTYATPAKEYSMQYMESGTWYNFGSTVKLGFSNGTPYGVFYSQGYNYFGVWDSRT